LGGVFVGDWLVRQFMVLGVIPLQNWMLLALAFILIGAFVSWWIQR
jgi:hypothetical protein